MNIEKFKEVVELLRNMELDTQRKMRKGLYVDTYQSGYLSIINKLLEESFTEGDIVKINQYVEGDIDIDQLVDNIYKYEPPIEKI